MVIISFCIPGLKIGHEAEEEFLRSYQKVITIS